MANRPDIIHSHWHHYFDELKFSSDEFYTRVQEIMKSYEFPNVSIWRVNMKANTWLVFNREYLRVASRKFYFDICAAPYGTGFFVSWWFGENMIYWRQLLRKIPFFKLFISEVPSDLL